jgi:hypothetical protein
MTFFIEFGSRFFLQKYIMKFVYLFSIALTGCRKEVPSPGSWKPPLVKLEAATTIAGNLRTITVFKTQDFKKYNFRTCSNGHPESAVLIFGKERLSPFPLMRDTPKEGWLVDSAQGRFIVHSGGSGADIHRWILQRELAKFVPGVLQISHVVLENPSAIECNLNLFIEEFRGHVQFDSPDGMRLSDQMGHRVMANGLRILKDLHAVGFIHPALDDGLMWIRGDPNSLRLRSFRNARRYISLKTGRVDGRYQYDTPAYDLDALHRTVRVHMESESKLMKDFFHSVKSHPITLDFDYDYWISKFESC